MHIPDALAKIVHRLMLEWNVFKAIANIEEELRHALEVTWMPDGGIEISCIYFW